MLLGVDCPTLPFPFTRQIVSQVSVDGGYIPFLMEPVNFMALLSERPEEKGSEQKTEVNRLQKALGGCHRRPFP